MSSWLSRDLSRHRKVREEKEFSKRILTPRAYKKISKEILFQSNRLLFHTAQTHISVSGYKANSISVKLPTRRSAAGRRLCKRISKAIIPHDSFPNNIYDISRLSFVWLTLSYDKIEFINVVMEYLG